MCTGRIFIHCGGPMEVLYNDCTLYVRSNMDDMLEDPLYYEAGKFIV